MIDLLAAGASRALSRDSVTQHAVLSRVVVHLVDVTRKAQLARAWHALEGQARVTLRARARAVHLVVVHALRRWLVTCATVVVRLMVLLVALRALQRRRAPLQARRMAGIAVQPLMPGVIETQRAGPRRRGRDLHALADRDHASQLAARVAVQARRR